MEMTKSHFILPRLKLRNEAIESHRSLSEYLASLMTFQVYAAVMAFAQLNYDVQ